MAEQGDQNERDEPLLPPRGFTEIAIPLSRHSAALLASLQPPAITRYAAVDVNSRKHGPISSEGSKAAGAFTLLCVDDNLILLRIMRKICEKWGQPYETAENGKEAVEIYKSDPNRYRCILMDTIMPVMDGRTATRLIREHEEASWSALATPSSAQQTQGPKPIRRAVIIALSARPVADDVANGFDMAMGKPIHVSMMADLLFGPPETNIVALYGAVSEDELRKAGYPLQMRPWEQMRGSIGARDVVISQSV